MIHVSAGAAKREWVRPIKQVYEVDPLVCPRCSGAMQIIAFIEPACADTADRQPEVVQKILNHLGLWPARVHSAPAPIAA